MKTSWSARQLHRWLAVAFTLSVLVNVVTFAVDPPEWIAYLALPPLLVLFASGAVLFFVPYKLKKQLHREEA